MKNPAVQNYETDNCPERSYFRNPPNLKSLINWNCFLKFNVKYILTIAVLAVICAGCESKSGPLIGVWRSGSLESEWGLLQMEFEFQNNNHLIVTMKRLTNGSETGSDIQEANYTANEKEISSISVWKKPVQYHFVNGDLIIVDNGGDLKLHKVRIITLSDVIGTWKGKAVLPNQEYNIILLFDNEGKVTQYTWKTTESENNAEKTQGTYKLHYDQVVCSGIDLLNKLVMKDHSLIFSSFGVPPVVFTRHE